MPVFVLSCRVCYAPTDAEVRERLNVGISILLGVTAVVLAGLLRFIVSMVPALARGAVFHDMERMVNR